MDGPGGGGHTDWVRGLARGLVRLVGGKKPQGGESTWMILARMGGGKTKERQGDLWLGGGRLLRNRTCLNVGGLRRTRRQGGALWDSGGLRGVRRSLQTVGLWTRRKIRVEQIKSDFLLDRDVTVRLLHSHIQKAVWSCRDRLRRSEGSESTGSLPRPEPCEELIQNKTQAVQFLQVFD